MADRDEMSDEMLDAYFRSLAGRAPTGQSSGADVLASFGIDPNMPLDEPPVAPGADPSQQPMVGNEGRPFTTADVNAMMEPAGADTSGVGRGTGRLGAPLLRVPHPDFPYSPPHSPRAIGRMGAQVAGALGGATLGGAVGNVPGAIVGGGIGSAGAGQAYDAALDAMLGTEERQPVLSGATAMDFAAGAVGPASGPIMRGARALGGIGARAPATATAAAGTAALTAAPGQTQEQDRIQTLRENLRTLEATRDSISKNISDVEAIAKQKKPKKEDVKRIQRLIGANDDGSWGPETRAAVAEYLAKKERERRETRADIDATQADIRVEQRAQRRQEAVERLLPWERFVVERPGLVNTAALIGGGVLPNAVRSGGAWARAALTRRARNQMILDETAPVESRVAGLNRFYSEGGGQEPFRIDPAAPHGFTPVARQQSASRLFPEPPRTRYGLGDVAAVAAPAGLTARAGYQHFVDAREELEDARRAADTNPSQENMDRLAQAEYRYNLTGASFYGASGASIGMAAYPFVRPQFSTRPNVQRAGAEVQRLNRLSRRDGGNDPLPPIETRRSTPNPEPGSGGHWVPRDAPFVPGQTEFVSPSGVNRVFLDAAGRWRYRYRGGKTGYRPEGPPDNYRRVSGLGMDDRIEMFGGFPVG